MSQPPSASLLWVNKDATNVHRKKHLAEVNAHVQKGSTKRKTTGRSHDTRNDNLCKTALPTRFARYIESTQPGSSSASEPHTPKYDIPISLETASDAGDEQLSASFLPYHFSHIDRASAPVFSRYSEDDVSEQPENITLAGNLILPTESELERDSQHFTLSLHPGLDVSNPLPGLLTGLSPHKKMLVHTYLTYMPRLVFGFGDRVVYCPIRTASITNMIRHPISTIWVLISLEMFLETIRGGSACRHTIIHQKIQAYQIMSNTLTRQTYSGEESALIASIAAATGELYCGDPLQALTHLNGVDAMLKQRGGLRYIQKLDVTVSMPTYAIFAYRTLLQDNLLTSESFACARSSFMSTIRAFVRWNQTILQTANLESPEIPESSTQDKGFDGEYDVTDGVNDLVQTRTRAFINHPLVRKFTAAEFSCTKPGEKIDHFLILYNLNLALFDYGSTPKHAVRFIEGFVQDVELGGSSPDEESSINVAGVHRLLTNRQVQMHVDSPGYGVARAWQGLDALEIMKLLTLEQRSNVCRTLHALLVGDLDNIMDEEDLATIESAITTTWNLRHPDQKPAQDET